MAELLFYPVLILLMIIQMVIVRHLPLFNGTVDLLLLWLAAWGLQKKGSHVWIGALFVSLLTAFVSAVPWYASLIAYLSVAIGSRFMNRHFWHNPLIALILIVFFCSLISLSVQMGAFYVQGISIGINDALKSVIIPSVFLNLVFAIPIYVIVNDMSRWVYPIEVDE
jgi:hypothetical protein